MNLDTGSIANFSPVDPDLYQVKFTVPEAEDPWTLPVIGFAVVVTYDGSTEGEPSDSKLYPVVLDTDGTMPTVYDVMQDWDEPRPTWALERKGAA